MKLSVLSWRLDRTQRDCFAYGSKLRVSFRLFDDVAFTGIVIEFDILRRFANTDAARDADVLVDPEFAFRVVRVSCHTLTNREGVINVLVTQAKAALFCKPVETGYGIIFQPLPRRKRRG